MLELSLALPLGHAYGPNLLIQQYTCMRHEEDDYRDPRTCTLLELCLAFPLGHAYRHKLHIQQNTCVRIKGMITEPLGLYPDGAMHSKSA